MKLLITKLWQTTVPRMCLFECSTIPNRNLNSKYSQSVTNHETRYRVMFFGTDDFALETLRKLDLKKKENCISHLEVCCISTSGSLVSKYAEKNGLKLHLYPPDIDPGEFDLGVVASFGKLISSSVITKFKHGMINVHGSILPKLRGAAPIVHAIRTGMKETGITIMKIKPKKFDVGEMLAQERVQIPPDLLRKELTRNMAVVGANLLWQVVDNLHEYEGNAIKQDDTEATTAPAIDKSIAVIDFNLQTNYEIYNLWRSIHDITKLKTKWKPTLTSVRFDLVHPPWLLESLDLDVSHPQSAPGFCVFSYKRKLLCIKCEQGWIAVDRIYYGKKKAMTPSDFNNGFLKKCDDPLFVKDDS